MGLQSPQFSEVLTRAWQPFLIGSVQAARAEETVASPVHKNCDMHVREGNGVPNCCKKAKTDPQLLRGYQEVDALNGRALVRHYIPAGALQQ